MLSPYNIGIGAIYIESSLDFKRDIHPAFHYYKMPPRITMLGEFKHLYFIHVVHVDSLLFIVIVYSRLPSSAKCSSTISNSASLYILQAALFSA